MDKKITTVGNLKTISATIKKFVNRLIGEVAETAASAIEEVESKINKIQDKGTGEVYSIMMEDGFVYLDDGKEESNE